MGEDKHKSFRIKKSRLGLTSAIIVAIIAIFSLIVWSTNSMNRAALEAKRAKKLEDAIGFCKSLFDETDAVRDDIKKIDLTDCDERLVQIKNAEGETEKLRENVRNALEYLDWVDNAKQFFDENGIVKETIQDKDITALSEMIKQIAKQYQKKVTEKYELIRSDYELMHDAENAVNDLFTSIDRADVRTDVNREEYEDAKEKVESLKQEGLKGRLNEALDKVLPVVEEQERIARERAEQIRREREEERRRIAESWTTLNISPYYINQYSEEIYNGCEAASLLMAAKYKGYLGGTDFRSFALNMPTSDDNPNEGFYLSITDLEPRDEAHWIAPAPLASYGRSKGVNVIDASGWSLDELDKEIENGNPVIIYVTYAFKDPKEYSKSVPKNLHVMVLSGYNSYNSEQQFYDPWPVNGENPTLSKSRTEYLYAASGYRALVVR